MKIAVICLSIASFAGIDASWSAFTPQCSQEKNSSKEFKILKSDKLQLQTLNQRNSIDTNYYPEDLNLRYKARKNNAIKYETPDWLKKQKTYAQLETEQTRLTRAINDDKAVSVPEMLQDLKDINTEMLSIDKEMLQAASKVESRNYERDWNRFNSRCTAFIMAWTAYCYWK